MDIYIYNVYIETVIVYILKDACGYMLDYVSQRQSKWCCLFGGFYEMKCHENFQSKYMNVENVLNGKDVCLGII